MVKRAALGSILGEATISTGNIFYEAMRTPGTNRLVPAIAVTAFSREQDRAIAAGAAALKSL